MSLDVICFGALNVDKLHRVDGIAGEGEERSIFEFSEFPGGSAANTAVGLARLGLRTGYIGKVSDDREGQLLINNFRKEGVNLDGVIVSKKFLSGVVIGFVDRKGERALYVNPGVNDSLEFGEIDLNYAKSAKFLHMTSFIGEKPFGAQKRLLSVLSDVKVSFDPGEIYSRKGLNSLSPILKRGFVVFLNKKEIKTLTGEDPEQGSKTLLREGAKIVVVKLGKKGCYVTDGRETHLIEPYDVKVIDTTGAGDAFSSGFLYGLIRGRGLFESGKLGNFVASRCISKMGARDGLPRISDLTDI
jgi:ribokinase